MSRITLKHISNSLNLSISTVSRALSDSYEVSKETKQRVIDFANKNNFQPNRLAKSLKTGKTNTIGVIVCSISNTFMSEILDGIQQSSIETGYDIIIMQSQEDEGLEKSCIQLLRSKGIDGLLISPVSESSNLNLLQQLQKEKCPVVIFDRIDNKLNTYKIGANNFLGAKTATQHLIEIGRKNILHITGSALGVIKERLKGYKSALFESGIDFSSANVVRCNIRNIAEMDKKIITAIEKSLQSNHPIDAIFGATDMITLRTLGLLAQMRIKVPEKIAVIGFANTSIAFALNPSLSTVSQPAKEIGILALSKLIYLIKKINFNDYEYETVELETQIHIRNSTVTQLD